MRSVYVVYRSCDDFVKTILTFFLRENSKTFRNYAHFKEFLPNVLPLLLDIYAQYEENPLLNPCFTGFVLSAFVERAEAGFHDECLCQHLSAGKGLCPIRQGPL